MDLIELYTRSTVEALEIRVYNLDHQIEEFKDLVFTETELTTVNNATDIAPATINRGNIVPLAEILRDRFLRHTIDGEEAFCRLYGRTLCKT